MTDDAERPNSPGMAMGVEPLVGASEEISGSYKVCDPCAEAFAA